MVFVLGIIYEYHTLLKLPIKKRFDICYNLLKTASDASLRIEAMWTIGKSLEEHLDDSLREKIEDLIADVLKNDENPVVKHEASFELGEHGVMRKLPALINASLNDPSELVRHESIEAIGLMGAYRAKKDLKKALKDHNEAVRLTAQIVLKQMERYKALD